MLRTALDAASLLGNEAMLHLSQSSYVCNHFPRNEAVSQNPEQFHDHSRGCFKEPS